MMGVPKVKRDDMMERMRAAVTLLNSGRFNERTKLIAFLSIQHPDMGPNKIVALANAMRADQPAR